MTALAQQHQEPTGQPEAGSKLAPWLGDLEPFIRAGAWAAGELTLAPNVRTAAEIGSEIMEWLDGQTPTWESALAVLTLTTEQMGRWEAVQAAALGVTVRIRQRQKAAEATAANVKGEK